MRETRKFLALYHRSLVTTGVKRVPVPWEFAALRIELRPTALAIKWIHFFFICAGIVIDHHICDRTHSIFVDGRDQPAQFVSVAVSSLDRTLLIMIPQVKIVVRIISIRFWIRSFGEGRKPNGIKSGALLAQVWNLLPKIIPPLAALVLFDRAIPVEPLHHDSHVDLSFAAQ